MKRLTQIFLLVLSSFLALGQNPHGETLTIDCAACHSPEGWEIAKEYWVNGDLVVPDAEEGIEYFSHSQTGFDLDGEHAQVDCQACHDDLVFAGTPTECIGCHVDLHRMTVGDDCARCHTTSNWLVDDIQALHDENGFPLLGDHGIINCNECHLSESFLQFDRIGNDCINCHMDDFVATTMPNHAEAGYSTDCMECHDPAAQDWFWTAGGANHSFFPLIMGHEINDCVACHVGGEFLNTPTDCFACHQMDFEATTEPNHVAAGFSTDCAQCHGLDIGWPAQNFDHSFFPLEKGHDIQDCTACHQNGNFENTPTDCFACHMDDYNNADDPNHIAAGFPTDCTLCHTTEEGWDANDFTDHDNLYFPIYSGTHKGEWDDCTECHTIPNNFAAFSCIDCHEHNDPAELADDHDDVNGYIYESNACYECHPTGEED